MTRLSLRVGNRSWGVTFWRETHTPTPDDPGRVISGNGQATLAGPPLRARRQPTRSTVIRTGFSPNHD